MLEVTGEVNEFGANAYVDAAFVRNRVANTVFILSLYLSWNNRCYVSIGLPR